MKTLYLVLAVVGAAVPYVFFIQHFSSEGVSLPGFVAALFANPAASGFTSDWTFRAPRGVCDVNLSPPLPKRPDRASRPPSWGRTRPVTVDSGQKQATGTWVSGGERYTCARRARRWSRAKFKWGMSFYNATVPVRGTTARSASE